MPSAAVKIGALRVKSIVLIDLCHNVMTSKTELSHSVQHSVNEISQHSMLSGELTYKRTKTLP